MPGFIFRMPANVPDLTYESLDNWLGNNRTRAIGTTVSVRRNIWPISGPAISIYLYGTGIARLLQRTHAVYFPAHGDTHMATGEWLGKIIRDNGIGNGVWRIRRRASDPLTLGPRGFTGPLAVDGDRAQLVEGRTYPAANYQPPLPGMPAGWPVTGRTPALGDS